MRPTQQPGWLWHPQPEAERKRLEEQDGYSSFRNILREIAAEKDAWAGIPIPIEDIPLVFRDDDPMGEAFKLAELAFVKEDDDDILTRNVFWSTWKRCSVAVVQDDDGKVRKYFVSGSATQTDILLNTLGASTAWGLEQEANAMKLLSEKVRHHTFKHYLLTGSFLETSKRSGITYLFRKLRPTLAIKPRDGYMHILSALCMHPIAYYQRSWAGAMCPTDDVLAHLMLMRGDEHLFWKRCNQHAPNRPEAGI